MPARTRQSGRGASSSNQDQRRRKRARVVESSEDEDSESPVVTGQKRKRKSRVAAQAERQAESEDAQRVLLEKHLTKKYPPPKSSDVNEILGPDQPVFDELWSLQDETDLMAAWATSSEKKDFESINEEGVQKPSGKHSKLQTMWKICLRLFRCSPLAILSPCRSLTFDPTVESDLDGDYNPNIWPWLFAEEFASLLTHPIWCGDADTLAFFLQFCVICRTDDRRLWNVNDRLLQRLGLKGFAEVLKVANTPLQEPVKTIHKAFRKAQAEEGNHIPIYSHLLKQIGIVVKVREGSTPRASATGAVIYNVRHRDLTNLRDAINRLGVSGAPMVIRVDVSYARYMATRQPHGLPQGMYFAELSAFHSRSWLHEQRKLGRKKASDARSSAVVDATLGVNPNPAVGSNLGVNPNPAVGSNLGVNPNPTVDPNATINPNPAVNPNIPTGDAEPNPFDDEVESPPSPRPSRIVEGLLEDDSGFNPMEEDEPSHLDHEVAHIPSSGQGQGEGQAKADKTMHSLSESELVMSPIGKRIIWKSNVPTSALPQDVHMDRAYPVHRYSQSLSHKPERGAMWTRSEGWRKVNRMAPPDTTQTKTTLSVRSVHEVESVRPLEDSEMGGIEVQHTVSRDETDLEGATIVNFGSSFGQELVGRTDLDALRRFKRQSHVPWGFDTECFHEGVSRKQYDVTEPDASHRKTT